MKNIIKYLNFNLNSNSIYYISDEKKWSFSWDAFYITEGLKNLGVKAKTTTSYKGIRNKIIHFGNRFAYLNGGYKNVHPSNYVFLTWFHGNPKFPKPSLIKLLKELPETIKFLEKIVVSCEISRQVLTDSGIPNEKLVTIPLGVDLNTFSPTSFEDRIQKRRSLGIPDKAICIGSFQKDGEGWELGLEPKLEKGPDIFLGVVKNLANYYHNLHIVLTGPARGYVKKSLKKLGVSYSHYLLDNYLEIVNYYHILDLYIIASRDEGGPKALLESWATGVPVISTAVGMSADIIEHSKNGMLSPVEDVDSLTQNAITLLEDYSLKNQCTQQALNEVCAYDWSLIAQQYYQKLYKPYL